MRKLSVTQTPRVLICAATMLLSAIAAGRADSRRAVGTQVSTIDAIAVTRWILEQQFRRPQMASDGAFKIHPTPGALGDDGKAYFRVVPYGSNLAVLGLLRARVAGSLPAARSWIDWYSRHLTPDSAPDGVPVEHYYQADGSGETACPNANNPKSCRFNDATDSAATTFFAVLWAYHQAGGDKAFLKAPRLRTAVRKLESVLMALRNPDSLFWAKRDYRVKYLEDNCEVFAGLTALSHLEGEVFGDRQRAALFARTAIELRHGILSDLFDTKTKLYRNAKFENGSFGATDLQHWETGAQAQFWPHLWGVVAASDRRSQRVVALVDAQWNGGTNSARNWPLVAGNADVAYAALLAADTTMVVLYLQTIKTSKLPNATGLNAFAWPFNIASAAWLLDILAARDPKVSWMSDPKVL